MPCGPAGWRPLRPAAGLFALEMGNLCGLEPQLIKLEFIIYLPKFN